MKLIDADELMKKVVEMNYTYTQGNAQWGEYYTEMFQKWIEEAKVLSPVFPTDKEIMLERMKQLNIKIINSKNVKYNDDWIDGAKCMRDKLMKK